MKYYILYHFRASASFKEKSTDYFKSLRKLKLLTNFDVSLTSSSTGGMEGVCVWEGRGAFASNGVKVLKSFEI